MTTTPVLVSAGILVEHGKVLLTQRKAGTHLEGRWEFPGGKVLAGEDPRAALVRELHEEVGIAVRVGAPLEVTFHAYAEKTVLLLFFWVERTPDSPDPRALDVADLCWATDEQLATLAFPEADHSVLAAVRRWLQHRPSP